MPPHLAGKASSADSDADVDVVVSIEEIEDAVLDGDSPIGPKRGTATSALRHRTFRLVFLGFFGSNIGTWMQNVVLGAYAYDITRSSTFVGIVIFAQLGPTLVFPMLGGLIADKVDRRKLLVLLSLEQLVFSLGLAFVVWSPTPSRLLLVLMVIMVGVGSAMFGPAYSAVVPMLVGLEDLPGAISLNSAQMNGSRVIGPIIGGLLFPLIGPAWIFVINAATYLFVVGSLLVVALPGLASGKRQISRWRELFAGITVAREDRVVGRALITVFVFSLLALAFIGQMPVVAAHNLGIRPSSTSYGILYACFGTGALVGAISIGTIFAHVSKSAIVRVCLICYSLSLTGFALMRAAIAAYFVVAVVGAFYFAFITSLNTAMQARLENDVRGRVMALWMMGFGGTVGVGNLIVGPIVSALGITNVLLLGAGVALLLAWYADVRAPVGRTEAHPVDLAHALPNVRHLVVGASQLEASQACHIRDDFGRGGSSERGGREKEKRVSEVSSAVARPPVVSAEEWQRQRDELLRAEKEATRSLDALASMRRRLPMTKFDNSYVFDAPEGPKTLLDLFDGREQLVVYQFMDNGPDAFCPGCTHFTNNVADLGTLHDTAVTFVTVSNMPLDQIQEYKARMGWTVPFVSSRANGFADDTGAGDLFRLTVFLRDGDDVYLTYSTTARGVDRLLFSNNILDLTPYGRQEDWEDSPPGWPQHPTYG